MGNEMMEGLPWTPVLPVQSYNFFLKNQCIYSHSLVLKDTDRTGQNNSSGSMGFSALTK